MLPRFMRSLRYFHAMISGCATALNPARSNAAAISSATASVPVG
jgi:hypothetical protein